LIHDGLSENEAALTWLEEAHKVRDVLLSAFITVDPSWDRLRGKQRFIRFLQCVKLD